jgi:hypothetical protein
MTLIEAIDQVNALKPNTYGHTDKVKWLSTLDGIVKREIIDTHEGAEQVTFTGYDEDTDLATELLVPAPYDSIYLRWLETQIDYANGEYARYNNDAQAFNDALSSFRNYYNRNYMPKSKKFKFFPRPKTPEYMAATAVAKVTIEED